MAVDGLLYTVVVLLVEIPNDPSSVDIEKNMPYMPFNQDELPNFYFLTLT